MPANVRVGATSAASIQNSPPGSNIPRVWFNRIDFENPQGTIIIGASPFSKLNVPFSGLYHVVANVRWFSGGGGTLRGIGISKNGTPTSANWLVWRAVPPFSGPSNEAYTLDIEVTASLNAGDYLEVGVRQDSGVNQVITGGLLSTPVFGFVKIE